MNDFENLTKEFEPGIKKDEFLFFRENNFNSDMPLNFFIKKVINTDKNHFLMSRA